MYQIISMVGEVLQETDAPHYVKLNSRTNTWVLSGEKDAEGVVINGKRYSIFGKNILGGSEKIVFVKKIDGAAKVQTLEKQTEQNSSDILDVIESVCEADVDKFDLMDAVVELDKKMSIIYEMVIALNKKLEVLSNG